MQLSAVLETIGSEIACQLGRRETYANILVQLSIMKAVKRSRAFKLADHLFSLATKRACQRE